MGPFKQCGTTTPLTSLTKICMFLMFQTCIYILTFCVSAKIVGLDIRASLSS
jgi:hypothetical protein